MKIAVFGKTDRGRIREKNEDAFVVADLATTERVHSMARAALLSVGERGVLVAVSDGMGGAQSGEIASALALHELRIGMDAGSAKGASDALRTSVEGANKNVWNFARASGKEGMGATLTAMLLHGHDAYVAEIGDSRAYLLRGDQFLQITHDQSFAQQLVDQGSLTPQQARDSYFKNRILQAVGIGPEVAVAMGRVPLCRRDRFLLCSDGLSNELRDTDMRAILGGASLEEAGALLVESANARGGKDNITALVLEVDGDELPVTLTGDPVSVNPPQVRPA